MKTRSKNTFIIAIIIGLIAHMYRLTNWMLGEDAVHYLDTISVSWVTSVGRYFLPVVEKIRGTYELSWLIGLFSIVCMALAAALIVDMYDIKGNVAILITCGIVVANPIVTDTFAFMYTADGYSFGLLLSTLAVYCTTMIRGKKGVILGIIAYFVSLGFYQGYTSAAIIFILLHIIRMLLDNKTDIKELGRNVLRYLIMGVAGLLIYLIFLKIVWSLGGYGVTSYMGIGNKSSSGIHKYIEAVINSYIDFARVFLVRYEITGYNVTSVLMFAFSGIMIIILLIKRKLLKQWYRPLLICIILLMLPVATHIFHFISEELAYTTSIMEYGTMMVFLLPVVLLRQFDMGSGNFIEWKNPDYLKKHMGTVAVSVLMLLICGNFIVISNKAYYNMFIANENLENFVNRLAMRMEMVPGYTDDIPVFVIGDNYQLPEYVTNAPMMSGVCSNIFLTGSDDYIEYMDKMMSTSHGGVSHDMERAIIQTEEFSTMEEWPSMNSIKVIDGVMVVVLSFDDDYDDMVEACE